jgi:hypothetical protein
MNGNRPAIDGSRSSEASAEAAALCDRMRHHSALRREVSVQLRQRIFNGIHLNMATGQLARVEIESRFEFVAASLSVK